MRSSIRSDWASRPTRGSRLVGLLSMIITKVSGSGLLEQESVGIRQTANVADARERHPTKYLFIPSEGVGALARRDGSRHLGVVCTRCSRIGDLPQYRRSLGPGSGRNVGGPPIPRLIRHERE